MADEPSSFQELDSIVPEGEEQTIQDIWKALSLNGDIQLVIDRVDEPRLRKQLSQAKAKENAKFKSAGLEGDNKTLEFIEIKEEGLDPKLVRIQIYLKAKASIKIHKMIISSGDLT